MRLNNAFSWMGGAAILFAAAGSTFAQNAHPSEVALTVVERFHAALKAGEAKTALAYLSDDAVIFESGYQETRSDYASHHLAADIEFAKNTQRTVKTTTQQCGNSLCVIMQQSVTAGKFKGKDVHSEGVETTVLRRDGEEWRIRHVHWSSHK